MSKLTRGITALLALLIISSTVMTQVTAYAADGRLPSGIAYAELDGAVHNYIREHEATTVGLAWSVFDTQDNISAGYYGYADRENGVPVDDKTVFEWGSGSKVLVWLCAMQLWEEGKLDLNADIRGYLPEGFLSNLSYDVPLTMLHLMNHTAGFQNVMADVNIDVPDRFANLEEAVSAHKPEQIYEPGTVTAYSNWGTSLAAYIIERLSGMEYVDYVHQHIFTPLKMDHSALYMDLSDNQWVQEKRKALKCYTETGELIVNDFNYVSLYPSGRCTSTFGDFETLAKAILRRDTRLMKAETWDELFTPTSFFEDTELAKCYHGFWAVYLGVPAIGHIGRTNGCASYLLVDFEDGIGSLFVCNQGSDTVYTEGVRPLIYGDFSYAKYGEEPAVPSKTYRNSNTVTKGPFKFFGFYSALMSPPLNLNQYWKLSPFATGTRVEFSYMDYTEVPDGALLAERLVVGGYILSLAFLLIALICRIPISLRRKLKKQGRRTLSVWSVIASVLPFMVTVLYLFVIISTGLTSEHYKWVFYVIAAITVIMLAMAVYGIIRAVKARLTAAQKIYDCAVALALILSVVYVSYWDMFMFWKL